MYALLLPLHSIVRWFVLISLLLAIVTAVSGLVKKRPYTALDNSIRHWTATIAHVQLLLGLGLYYISPITDYFLNNFNSAIHQREMRFFGMEHSLMMFLAIVTITIGSSKAKRKTTHGEKFKTVTIWYAIGLFLILTSIPWEFSPFTSRPYFRWL